MAMSDVSQALSNFPAGMEPRPQQAEAIRKAQAALESGKRFVVVEGPTGSGKSALVVALARTYKPAFLTTPRILLQEQYARDFPELPVLKGKSNYVCRYAGPEGGDVCKTRGTCGPIPPGHKREAELLARDLGELLGDPCEYWLAKKAVIDAEVANCNFHSLYYNLNQLVGKEKRRLLAIDECHRFEDATAEMVSLSFSQRRLDKVGLILPDFNGDVARYVTWFQEIRSVLAEHFNTCIDGQQGLFRDKSADGRRKMRELSWELQDLERILGFLGRVDREYAADPSNWVVIETRNEDKSVAKIEMKPVVAKKFAAEFADSCAQQYVFLSATILDYRYFCRTVGLDPADGEFVQMPCTFPEENRLIWKRYVGRLNRETLPKLLPRLIGAVREILDEHAGDRGIIHANSYQICDAIHSGLNGASSRLIYPRTSKEQKEAVKRLSESKAGVLLSPSMMEGVDLKDDLSRFQVVAKVAWPNLGDRRVRARTNMDPDWYEWATALSFAQAAGRSIRCFDLETELLTQRGWKKYDQIESNDASYGIDPRAFDTSKTKRPLRWGAPPLLINPIRSIHVNLSPEKMIEISSRNVDIRVTPDHDMAIQTISDSRRRYKGAYRKPYGEYPFSTHHVARTVGLRKTKARDLPPRFKIPLAGRIIGRRRTRLSREWFWLMGIVISDGYISRTKTLVCVYQSDCRAKIDTYRKIDVVLRRLGLQFRKFQVAKKGSDLILQGRFYKRTGNVWCWAISGFNAARIRDVFIRGRRRRYSSKRAYTKKWKTVEKGVPRWVFERMPRERMLDLVNGMMAGDGSKRPKGWTFGGTYFTKEDRIKDDFQELLSLTGFGSIARQRRGRWEITFRSPALYDCVARTCVREAKREKTWCVNTKLGTVLVRRNGKPFIAGNSETDHASTYVLDGTFDRLLGKGLFPKWMARAVRDWS